jgi:hypothetical protein
MQLMTDAGQILKDQAVSKRLRSYVYVKWSNVSPSLPIAIWDRADRVLPNCFRTEMRIEDHHVVSARGRGRSGLLDHWDANDSRPIFCNCLGDDWQWGAGRTGDP